MINKFDKILVSQIADLANLSLTKIEIKRLIKDFNKTLLVVDKLTKIEKSNKIATTQVNNLKNIYRSDEIQPSLSQKEALKNASKTYRGYFLVERLINQD